jgi:hypothetical protein
VQTNAIAKTANIKIGPIGPIGPIRNAWRFKLNGAVDKTAINGLQFNRNVCFYCRRWSKTKKIMREECWNGGDQ